MRDLSGDFKGVIGCIKNEKVKRWYSLVFNNEESRDGFCRSVYYVQDKGYHLDKSSGLWTRKVLSEDVLKRIDRTIVDIAFFRPIDLHYHEDISEIIRVLDGSGIFLCYDVNEKINTKKIFSHKNNEVYIPRQQIHSFGPNLKHQSTNGRPMEGGYKNIFAVSPLELRIACDGTFNPEKEICVSPFDEFAFWPNCYNMVDYYEKRDEMEK